GAVIMLTLVLTLFVFPRFLSQFAHSGIELPLPTRILLGLEELFEHNKPACIALIFGLPATYRGIRNIKPVRWQIDRYKLKVPVIGPLVTKVLMSRFAHNLAM